MERIKSANGHVDLLTSLSEISDATIDSSGDRSYSELSFSLEGTVRVQKTNSVFCHLKVHCVNKS